MPVAEAGGRRNRLLDRVGEVDRALERPLDTAPDDCARDLAGVALLAVPLEDQAELSLVRLVHELAGRELGGAVHPHVERRVGGVREAPFRAVELHRGDAEVEQDRVRLDVVGSELVQDERELPAEEPGLDAAGRGLEAVEVDAGVRVAVDRDQLPLAAEVGGEQARMPARAERAVDDGLARAHVEELAHLLREDGNVISASLQGVRQHRLRSLRPW